MTAPAPLTDSELAKFTNTVRDAIWDRGDEDLYVRGELALGCLIAEVERLRADECMCIPYHLIGCPQYAESWRRRVPG